MEMLYRDNYSSKCLADLIASLTSYIGALHARHSRFISYKIDTDEHPPTGLMYLWSSLDWGRYLLGNALLGFSDVGCRRNTSPLNQNPQSCQILAFPKRAEIVTNKHRLKTPVRRFDRSTYSAWREGGKRDTFTNKISIIYDNQPRFWDFIKKACIYAHRRSYNGLVIRCVWF